jgi:crotonobetainyl-CoA:carnitine CoA-transferase CaiB-like acyl-CoA transferase
MQALDNVTVLDLTHHIAGPYATRLMADLGADVIKIERPGGDLARQLGPFQGNEPNPEKSGLFFYLNCNKRSVVLDLRSTAGKEALAALAARADLVVESFAPGVIERLGIGFDFFRGVKADLPLVSISNFGQTGPYRDYKATELVMYAFAGEMYTMGMPDREPVKMAGTAALFESGAGTAVALMGALFASKRHGIGQHVDISIAETHFGGVDRRPATAIAYQFSGRKSERAASAGGGMPQGIYPCADGYIDFTNAGLRPDRVADMLNHAEWLNDPRFSDPIQRMDPFVIEEWNTFFLGWCLERTKREIWAEVQRAKVLAGPLFTMEDLYHDSHFRDRGLWTKVRHAEMGDVEMVGRPFLMGKGGWELRRPAPRLGEHTHEVLKEAGVAAETIDAVMNQEAVR